MNAKIEKMKIETILKSLQIGAGLFTIQVGDKLHIWRFSQNDLKSVLARPSNLNAALRHGMTENQRERRCTKGT